MCVCVYVVVRVVGPTRLLVFSDFDLFKVVCDVSFVSVSWVCVLFICLCMSLLPAIIFNLLSLVVIFMWFFLLRWVFCTGVARHLMYQCARTKTVFGFIPASLFPPTRTRPHDDTHHLPFPRPSPCIFVPPLPTTRTFDSHTRFPLPNPCTSVHFCSIR